MGWLGRHKQHLEGHENFIYLWNLTKSGAKTKNRFSSQKLCNFPRILVFPKNEQNSAKSEVKTNKKDLHPEIYANFDEFVGATTQTNNLYCTIYKKKQFLFTNSGLINSILGVSGLELHSSRTEPVNFFEEQSSLREAQFSFWDAQAVIWGGGHGLGIPPRGARPRWRKAFQVWMGGIFDSCAEIPPLWTTKFHYSIVTLTRITIAFIIIFWKLT